MRNLPPLQRQWMSQLPSGKRFPQGDCTKVVYGGSALKTDKCGGEEKVTPHILLDGSKNAKIWRLKILVRLLAISAYGFSKDAVGKLVFCGIAPLKLPSS